MRTFPRHAIALLAMLVIGGCATNTGKFLDPGSLLLVEVSHPLVRSLVDADEIAPDEREEELGQHLLAAGFTNEQIDAGRVWVVREFIYWNNTASGIKHSHYGFTLSEGDLPVQPGAVVELRVRDGTPSVIERVRAPSLAEGGCFYLDLEGSVLRDLVGLLAMVGPPGAASLYCPDIEKDGWQRPRTFWHKPPGALVSAAPAVDPARSSRTESPPLPVIDAAAETSLAHVLIQRDASWARFVFSLPVWVDGEKLTELEDGQCDVILLPPGEHRVAVGNDTLFGVPRRELSLHVERADHLVLEYRIDDDKWNSYGIKGLLTPRKEIEDAVFSFTQRPATAGDGCILRGPPRLSPRAARQRP